MRKAILLPFLFLLLHVQAQDGTLDPTFGTGGFVRLGSSYDATAFQSDGKLLGVQKITGGFILTRYNTDGVLDKSFGNGGIVTLQIPYLTTPSSVLVATQVNGNIVVEIEGTSNYYTSYSNSYKVLALVRLSSKGALDTTFGTDGIVLKNVQEATSIIYPEPVPTTRFIAVRYDGYIVTAVNYGLYRQSIAGVSIYDNNGNVSEFKKWQLDQYTFVTALAVGESGEIAVGLGAMSGYSIPPCGYTLSNEIVSINSGQTYGYVSGCHVNTWVSDIAIQNDGKILAGSLIRYNTNGETDPAFGINGVVNPEFGVNKIVIQSDGKIIAGGSFFNGTNSDFSLARYNTNGTLDTKFGNKGMTRTDFGGAESIHDIIINNNRLYAYGSGILTAYQLTSSCTSPLTLRNDGTIVLDADCSGKGGLITLIPTSGTAPFMYSIDGGMTYVNGPATGYSFQNLSAGTYQLRIKDANGCESAVLSKEVRRYYGGPLFLNDGTIVLDASCGANDGNISIIPTCGAAPFQYSIDGGKTYVNGTATGYTFQNLAPGTYQLRLKDAYGTESAIVTRQVRPDFYGPCAINTVVRPGRKAAQAKDGSASLQVYPNPSKGRFQVQLGRFNSPRVQLQVVDARGAVLQQRTLNTEQKSVVDIDLSGKAKGLYLIRVVGANGTQQTKVLIQ